MTTKYLDVSHQDILSTSVVPGIKRDMEGRASPSQNTYLCEDATTSLQHHPQSHFIMDDGDIKNHWWVVDHQVVNAHRTKCCPILRSTNLQLVMMFWENLL